jgi:hypothetical protein
MEEKTATKELPYVIARCYRAGVHAGELVRFEGQEVELRNSRRIWYWKGAASLSELAAYGMKYPEECKFGCELKRIIVTDCCELIYTHKEGEEAIRKCPEWRA